MFENRYHSRVLIGIDGLIDVDSFVMIDVHTTLFSGNKSVPTASENLGEIFLFSITNISTFEPTLFTLETNLPLNDEQQAVQIAYHELATFNVFDNRMFFNTHEFATNHLLTWCSEVLSVGVL